MKSSVSAFASAVLLLLHAGAAMAQNKSAWPVGSLTSISQTVAAIAGVPTLLTVGGIGNCTFRLSYVKQGGSGAASMPLVFSSTPQSPFPMQLKIWDATPAGTYTWTASGMNGCVGSLNLTFTVR